MTPTTAKAHSDVFISLLQESAQWVFDEGGVKPSQSHCIDVEKSWDVIDRALQTLVARGEVPNAAATMLVSGAQVSHTDFGVFPKSVQGVSDTAAALLSVTKEMFCSVKALATAGAYVGDAVDDGEYIDYFWENFDDARWFYACAAGKRRPIVVVQH